MKLYNVHVKGSYGAAYEGPIDTSYSVLVFANSEQQAISLVEEDISETNYDDYRVVKSAEEILIEKGKNKRKPIFYHHIK